MKKYRFLLSFSEEGENFLRERRRKKERRKKEKEVSRGRKKFGRENVVI